MTPFAARLQALERRMAVAEADLRQTAARSRSARLSARLAAIAGEGVYRQPPPWLPRGTVPVTYRVLGPCAGNGPIAGAVVTTLYQGLVLDVRQTTGDGYAVFGGVAGVGYSYTVAAGTALLAASGTYTLPNDGLAVTRTLAVAPPGRCIPGCPIPVAPPYRYTDPVGSFTLAGDAFNDQLTFDVARPLAVKASTACASPPVAGTATVRYRISPGFGYALTLTYPWCASGPGVPISAAFYPVSDRTPDQGPVNSLSWGGPTIQCSPFRMSWTRSDSDYSQPYISRLFGASPATITLERA